MYPHIIYIRRSNKTEKKTKYKHHIHKTLHMSITSTRIKQK